MPSLHRFTDWLFHFKLSQDTMPADQPFEATHILQWRYRDTKPLRKALEAFQFEKKDIRIRVCIEIWCLIRRGQSLNLWFQKSTKQGTTIEVQLPRGRELTKVSQAP